MKKMAFFMMALSTSQSNAQSALEHYAWQDPYPLMPLSRTAIAVTGPVRITNKTISFNGKFVFSKLYGQYWRIWDESGKKNSASIYELKSDPGKLRQGNTLCGSDQARYIVIWQNYDDLTGGSIRMNVYSSQHPPQDGDSEGLCGTYSYIWKIR